MGYHFHFSSLVNTFFQMCIVLGIYNFVLSQNGGLEFFYWQVTLSDIIFIVIGVTRNI